MESLSRDALLQMPAAQPPPGIRPDLTDPKNLRVNALASVIIVTVFAIISMAVHAFTKAKLIKRLRVEDYLLYFALLVYCGAYFPIGILIVNIPIGVHQWNMTIGRMINLLYYYHLAGIFGGVVLLFLKASIILQTLNIFIVKGQRGFVFWAGHILVWTNIVAYIILTFFNIFTCTPYKKAWDFTILDGRCFDASSIYLASSIFGLLSDFLMFLLPQSVIWKLRMTRQKRLGVSAVFFTGFLASVFAAIRLYYTVQLTRSPDTSYYAGWVGIWVFPEIAVGFVVASLPCFPKFIQTAILKMRGRNKQESCASSNGPLKSITGDYQKSLQSRSNSAHETYL